MPVARVQMPDGRIGRFEVPEGTTPEQVIEYAKGVSDEVLQLKVGESTPGQVQQVINQDPLTPQTKADQSVSREAFAAQNFPQAAEKRGLLDIGEGLKQTAIQAGESANLLPQGSTQDYTQQVEEGRKEFEATYGRVPGAEELRVIAAIAPYIYLPAKGASTLKGQMAVTGATGAAIAGTQFAPEGQSRAENAAKGGAVAAAIPPVLRAGGAVVGKVVNALQGKLKPEAAKLLSLGEQHNVPVFAPDVGKGPIMNRLSTATESFPAVGMGGPRQIQNVAADRAAQAVKGQFDGGGDWTKTVQASLRSQAKKVRGNASRLYDRVNALADPKGVITPKAMNAKATSLLNQELAKPEAYQDKSLIKILEKYSTDPQMNFSGLRQLRSDIGSEIDDYYKGVNGLVGKKGVDKLQQIKNALESDLEKTATTGGPELKAAWKKADTYYRQRVVPFKDSALAKAAKTDTPDEIYKTFIKRGGRDRAQKFYNALDNSGKEAVRRGMLEDAYGVATAEGRPFSPARFAGKLESLQDATGVFFKGKDKSLVDGFTKLMRHVERSGQFMENPPTGNRVIPILLAGGAAIQPGATAGAVGITYALKLLFTSGAGKNLLLAASKAKPEAMPGLVNRLEDVLARISAANAGQLEIQAPAAPR